MKTSVESMGKNTERDQAIASAKKKAVESLSSIILGERLPIPIFAKGGRLIIAARKRVTSRAVHQIVEAYPDLEMETTPVRIGIMQNLAAYGRALEDIRGRYQNAA